jgi:hypothetical protein
MKKLGVMFVLVVPALVAVQGCGSSGPSLSKLTGTVTYKNQPAMGTLVIIPPDGKALSVPIGEGGAYSAKVPPGAVKFGVHIPKLEGGAPNDPAMKNLTPEMKAKMQKAAAGTGGPPLEEMTAEQRKILENLQSVPERYRNATTSMLTTTVVANQDNTFDIKLDSK